MKRKRVLITGAAGAVGTETARALLESGQNCIIRTFDLPGRKAWSRLFPLSDRLEMYTGSITDREAVDKALEDVDFVIHLASVSESEADAAPERAGDVNIWGTHRIIDGMKRLVPDAFLLFPSSVSVYGDRLSEPWISVGDRLKPSDGDYYGGSKACAEGLISRSGLRHSIFRITEVMDPGFVTGKHINPMIFHMPLNTHFEFVTARDAGFAMSEAVSHEGEIEGQCFNLAGGEACRIEFRDMVQRTFEILGLDFDGIDKNAFAIRNFHSGYFKDSEMLEEILHFQRDTVETYFTKVKKSLSRRRHLSIALGKQRIIRFLLSKSDPLNAIKAGNDSLIERFFGHHGAVAPGS